MRGIRGATQVAANRRHAIEEAVVELCRERTVRNRLTPEEIAWAIFTMTHDLDVDFPARGARVQGWHQVPMTCSQEFPVPGSMPRVIRVLLHVESRGTRARRLNPPIASDNRDRGNSALLVQPW